MGGDGGNGGKVAGEITPGNIDHFAAFFSELDHHVGKSPAVVIFAGVGVIWCC